LVFQATRTLTCAHHAGDQLEDNDGRGESVSITLNGRERDAVAELLSSRDAAQAGAVVDDGDGLDVER
jgi:hypothetical protein